MQPLERQSKLAFLTLPLEIRQLIYDHIFRDAALIFETHPKHHVFLKDPPFWIHLSKECNILFTCKQICAETQPRVLGIDSLRFQGANATGVFIQNTSQHRRDQIKHVSNFMFKQRNYENTLTHFANLQSVHLGPIRCFFRQNSPNYFEQATFDDILTVLTSENMDFEAPYGVETMIQTDRYQRFIIDAGVIIHPVTYGGEWKAVPCTLDAIERLVVKHYDQAILWNAPADLRNSICYRAPPSHLAKAEHLLYEKNPQVLKHRYKRFLG